MCQLLLHIQNSDIMLKIWGMSRDRGQVEAVYVDEVCVEDARTVYHAGSEVVREEAADWVL